MSEYLNTTVECIRSAMHYFTPGKKYSVINGFIAADDGFVFGGENGYKTFEEFYDFMHGVGAPVDFKEVSPTLYSGTIECVETAKPNRVKVGELIKVFNGEIDDFNAGIWTNNGKKYHSLDEINEHLWDEKPSFFRFKEVQPQFTKSDLRSGMKVRLEDDSEFLVMRNPDCKLREMIDFRGGFDSLSDYDEYLRSNSRGLGLDIVEVYSADIGICRILSNPSSITWKSIWKRPDPPKQITMTEAKEICKDKIGCEVEIVGDEK